ncbi:MAG: ribose 1,5-bisphosphate isomerase [Candidatus Jordarchaeum sp.]|uniref:ribose 1,5-bisphosphate isomerase n=1 Tax=Candidatus Jordarchaeum sp. TaxID=2823881 RepID=UPI00404B6A9F
MFPDEVNQIARDIESMRIRGAGNIARAAVKTLRITVQNSKAGSVQELLEELRNTAQMVIGIRPTAVSLPNGIRFVSKRVNDELKRNPTLEELKEIVEKAVKEFIVNSERAVLRIGEIGSKRIRNGDVLLTHCNSAAALSVILTAAHQNKDIKVFATETRPRFQGHITCKILRDAGIDVTLIVDSAIRLYMNKVNTTIVGADAISSNGALVNKIGTSTVALVAKEARTLFFVATETYKFSPETMIGELIEIEERDIEEVIDREELEKIGNPKVLNPAFDITPSQYIDLIITEKGIIPPQAAFTILQDEFGWVSGLKEHLF